MNREDIIRMAREAGFSEWAVQTPKDLERFAALVAAAEREACAKVCDLAEDANTYQGSHRTISSCAKAIRARGEE